MTRPDGTGRRRALAWMLVAWLIAVGGAGCRPRQPIPADVLIIGQTAEPKSLDPHLATALNDFRIAANLYEGLVRFEPGSLVIGPGLAKSWSVSPDGRTYTFRLREGVRFHDGTVLDSAAVRFNFERLLAPGHSSATPSAFPLAFFFEAIEEIETPDPQTVVFHLGTPFAPLLSNLASPTGFLVSPSAVQQHGSAFGRHPCGTGPYRFVEWAANRFVRLERFEDYHGTPARTPTLYFRPLTDENARLTELLAGGVDLIAEAPADMAAYFRTHRDFRVYETAGPHLWFLILNTRHGPFADLQMRRAANLAIDREALTRDLLQGTATQAVGAIPRAFEWAVDPELEPYPHDPARARQLIREAGYEGASVTFYATESGSGMLAPREMAAAIQADLAAVGLQVNIETYEWNTFLDRVNAGLGESADMAQMAWMVNDPDTLPFLALRREAWPEEGGFNSGYYSQPEVDRLLLEARTRPDPAERGAIYRKIEALTHADAPWVFVASWKQNAVVTERVHGLQLEPSFLFYLDQVWKSNEADMP